MSWLRYFRRRRRDLDFEDEVESYLALSIAENIEAGMSPTEAADAARRKFGNVTLIKETVHEMNSIHWFEDALGDLRYGCRVLARNPGFFLVATLSLALGIGANTAIFGLLNAVELRQLPVANAAELVRLRIAENEHCCNGNFSARNSDFTYQQWEQIRDRQQAFSGIFAFGDVRFNLAERGEARFVDAFWVSGGFFSTLGVKPALGRLIEDADDRLGCGAAPAVISHGFWQSEYGGARDILGRKILLNGKPADIVGVASPGFFGVEVGRSAAIYVPACAEPFVMGEQSHLAKPANWWLAIMGRRKPDWTFEKTKAHAAAISAGVFESTVPTIYRPDTAKWYAGYKLEAQPGETGVSGLREDYEKPLWLLLGIAAAVLLIACANLANLMLARASVREREMAVRVAIGAGRGRLVRQLLTENALLTVGGALAGALLARELSRYLVSFLSTQDSPLYLDLSLDWRMLVFATAVAVFTAILFGLAPALRSSRTEPGVAMRAGGRSITADRTRFSLRRALVVSQVALSLVLLTGALLFGTSLRNLNRTDLGLNEKGLLIMDTDLSNLHFTPEKRGLLFERLLARLRSTPGVESASSATEVQMSGDGWNNVIEFLDHETHEKRLVPWFDRVSTHYFETAGIPLLTGRDFNDRDTVHAPEVAVVSQTFSDKFLGGANPIGHHFRTLNGPGEPEHIYEIVGMVRASKYRGVKRDMEPLVYLAASQEREPRLGLHILLRSSQPLGSLSSVAKRAVLEENGDILLRFLPFERMIQESLVRDRLMAALSGFFGLLAAVLATIGLYGVMSYIVEQRKTEIGIRMALGANSASVVRLVIREASLLLGIGLLIGVLLTAGGARLAKSLLYGLEAHDPLTIAMAVLLLATVSLAASFLPARRAASVDPMLSLRGE